MKNFEGMRRALRMQIESHNEAIRPLLEAMAPHEETIRMHKENLAKLDIEEMQYNRSQCKTVSEQIAFHMNCANDIGDGYDVAKKFFATTTPNLWTSGTYHETNQRAFQIQMRVDHSNVDDVQRELEAVVVHYIPMELTPKGRVKEKFNGIPIDILEHTLSEDGVYKVYYNFDTSEWMLLFQYDREPLICSTDLREVLVYICNYHWYYEN